MTAKQIIYKEIATTLKMNLIDANNGSRILCPSPLPNYLSG